MKLILVMLTGLLMMTSCKKEDQSSSAPTQQRLQHDWVYHYNRIFFPSGNSYLLKVDNRSFRKDGLTIGITAIASGVRIYDTAAYELISANWKLLFYNIRNGVRQHSADTAIIRELTDTSLIYYFQYQGFTNSEASLHR